MKAKKNAVNRLKHDFCDVHQLFSVPPRTGTDRYLKYCPICAEEDRQKYGEAYWHRSHQIAKLPKCKTILDKYTEAAEANMARRIVWAYKRLKSEQSDKIYWSDLRSLSGVKRANIGKVIPYIYKADTNIADEILSIL